MSFISPEFLVDANYDAFKRIRVAPIQTLFESKLLHDKQPIFWDEEFNLGGSSSFNATNAATSLGVPATNGAYSYRQTRQRFPYQAGKSSLIVMTGRMDSAANTTRRVGQFNGVGTAGDNGFYFEHDGTNLSVNIEKNGSTTSVNQSAWNRDRLDGGAAATNPSGITLDLTKTLIFFFDYEWLGVGRVRFGFLIAGQPIVCHEFLNSNVSSSVYTSTPNLPLRWEISSQGSAGELDVICSSVSQEGGSDTVAPTRACDTGVTKVDATSTGTKYAIVGYRVQTGRENAILIPNSVDVFAQTNDAFFWQLQLNPTLAGTNPVTASSLTNSSIECLRSQTGNGNAETISADGIVLASGYVAQQTRNVRTDAIRPAIWPGVDLAGARDEIWITVEPLNNGLDLFASIGIREVG